MGEPKLIKNWIDLAQVEDSETHRIEVDKVGDILATGWIVNKENGERSYLSTHTFYGNNFEHSTNRLQECGFNIEIDNWDKETTNEQRSNPE